ncbi:cyclic nucleotide-binding domain-containing protein [Sulfuriflexus mobilis]|uniref:cyclic nucleotide-binding domain-containing protein n=1 Tax=Sulfuriflexus mobilis TaxID=1811807 RepID=UPI000F83AEB3|nr:cyclic nucleotide-binding domain-containing protein [Sulfuriflexus mobilis]
MHQTAHQLDPDSLRRLQPLGSLTETDLRRICDCAQLLHLQPGEALTMQDQTPRFLDYLISGEVELCRGRHTRLRIQQHSSQARRPLHDSLSQYEHIAARTRCTLLRIDQEQLERLLQSNWQAGYDIEELHVDSDMHAMSHLLQNRCLLALPPDNIESVMALMQSIEVQAGETIIWQGEYDDGYYTVLNGHCRVSRRPHALGDDIRLAELGPGASFGEEALITGSARNATISMLTDGVLMRLDKKYFLRYVVNELIHCHDYRGMLDKLRQGAKLIDVRSADEHGRNGYGLHIPLPLLRLRLQKLGKGREYVFCCSDGQLSTAAAFIALQQGFTASVLKGGLRTVPREYLSRYC